jgi:putative endonuclease
MPERWTAYVLKSLRDEFNYVGMTSSLPERLRQHASGKTKTTRWRGPFQVVCTEEFPTRAEAREREKYFKTSAGRRFLKKHVSCHPESLGFPARTTESSAASSFGRQPATRSGGGGESRLPLPKRHELASLS